MHEYGLTITNTLPTKKFDAEVLGALHNLSSSLDLNTKRNGERVVYDVKGVLESCRIFYCSLNHLLP